MKEVIIKKLNSENLVTKGLKLSLEVFTKCNKMDYNDEGYRHFNSYIENKEQVSLLSIYGAFINENLVGIIGVKENGHHISLFFVDEKYQGLKIGRKLFAFAQNDTKANHIIVNSSTSAVEMYKKLGFNIIREQITRNGLTSVLMEYKNND
ncbi:Acetyltransferase [Capnocytophaga canimorsus]|uniref:Acetyltransferase n=1 Tax=Capnocytophaga canimorsus TaxID=28188 RepID=A0A0B7HVK7_9FLAO|nr:GNAT family N-acetyltransferase [Capnocytophaga canimorsus]ATA77180.1 N-acetyltransferase [Capnocytophaga canimorsus]PJI83672.1 acetyltransferase (GNAT) family protein [Capnocytophaga canimorsus]CEN41553.1 Acetyltransferase [Capnocytophaga canimorsus]STA72404.1 Acetyltransferase (GNAT) family [Capnocytophaga canimorsus]